MFNEIWNSMVCFISGYAPVWGAPVGVGITACLMLSKDPKARILGINNRVFLCVVLTTLAVIIECFLNYCGILTWEWPFWQRSCPWLIWLIGYLPFFTAAFYVHDRPTVKVVGGILGFDLVLLVICTFMGWI